MKQFKLLFIVLGFLFVAGSISSCGGKGKSKTEVKTGKEYTSAFICPMHCDGSGSDKAGKCPACKMNYTKNKDYKAPAESRDSHDHGGHEGHDHNGHDHHNHEGHNH